MTMDDATRAQVDAADPRASTWLSANAGSGKTRVLTDRVARLLLAGTDPRNILCLTYTKAAASEMQNRLFRRLGEWAMMPEPDLKSALFELGVDDPVDTTGLADARKLFAAAIETPGGLKIQTIHSFCAGILRRFPLEAGISPQFREMEDHETDLLRGDILEAMAEDHDKPLVDALARQFTGAEIGKLLKEITGNQEEFPASVEKTVICEALGVDPDITPDSLASQVFGPDDKALLSEWIEILSTGSSTEIRAANQLSEMGRDTVFDPNDLKTMESVFLFGSSAKVPFGPKIGSFPTKDTRGRHPDLCDALNDLMQRVADSRPIRLRTMARDRTLALHRFATAFIARYIAEKQRRGVLDFDDLIHKTRDLLTDPAVAQWVLFRLDGGVDHILVDEAQDTSPVQWQIIELLTQEFTSGEGARAERDRTMFVVGDRKQSIYSFQGADPDELNTMRDQFGRALGNVGKALRPRELRYSFRSSAAILNLVDQVFTGDDAEGVGEGLVHLPFHAEMPGRVDLWPVIEKTEQDQPEWDDPRDVVAESHHEIQLARNIAAEIERIMKEEKLTVPRDGSWVRRPVTPGDFLILVRRRSSLFTEIIGACKAAGLEIAGADRMYLGDDLGVRDILSCLRFLALPEDDLSLAEALKSPVFGWTESDLFSLAHGRPEGRSLWETLRARETEFPQTLTILHDLRDRAEFLRPYDLINRILLKHDGRRKLIARLGHQAEDGIDALLAQSLSFERSDVPSLTGFLAWFDAEQIQIKRQMDSAGDRIRVMTVHGAKGLEAPIVILPDTTDRKREHKSDILSGGPVPIWKPRKPDEPPELGELREAGIEADSREFRRLLYVALTRAESWLIVAGAGTVSDNGENWYNMVGKAMAHIGAANAELPGIGSIQRAEFGDWTSAPVAQSGDATDEEPENLPPFGDTPKPDPRLRIVAPSDLGGAKALPGDIDEDDTAAAKARGRIIHSLSEVLPDLPARDRRAAAKALVGRHPEIGLVADRDALVEEVLSMLDRPELARIFETGLAEVDITATLPGLGDRRIHGAIDRLVVTDSEVLAVDLKSNREVPDSVTQVPVGLRRQMAAYRDALAQVYPGRSIRVALLWTRTGALMTLPDDMLTDALAEATVP
jgi:ATP-dependent helicase/nuclease subunit A